MSKLSQSEIDALFAQYSADPSAAAADQPGADPGAAFVPPSDPSAAAEPPSMPGAARVPMSGAAPDPMTAAMPITFPKLDAPAPAPAPVPQAAPQPASQPIGLLAHVELDITVRLGRTRKSIREILSLGPGAVLELETVAGESVDILVNGLLVAKGEVVVLGENYGVRIVELINHPSRVSFL